MEESFESILSSILDSIEENPGKDVDQILADKLSDMGVSPDGKQLSCDTMSLLEAIEEKKKSLREAKAAGSTREVWMQEQLYDIVSKQSLSEGDKGQLISDIENMYNESLKGVIEKGE